MKKINIKSKDFYSEWNKSVMKNYGTDGEEIQKLREMMKADGISIEHYKFLLNRVKELEQKQKEKNEDFSKMAIR